MPTIRQRFVNFVLGDEVRRIERTAHALFEAYQDGPYQLPPEQLVAQLKEYDSAALEDLVMGLQWEKLGMLGYGVNSDRERQRMVDESNRLWRYNPLAQWCVWTWTNYGFGDAVTVTCDDEDADAVFQDMWQRNEIFSDDHLHELSHSVLVNGDIFLVCYESTLDGTVNFSVIPQNEIQEIITDPANALKPIYYKRQFTINGAMKTLYYPDWHALNHEELDMVTLPRGAERADKPNSFSSDLGDERPATVAYILHIAHNRKDYNSLRGWPILGIAAAWLRAQKRFMEDRATVSAQKASIVREFITAGGSRGVASIKSKLASTLSSTNYTDTNPPGVGTNMIHNQSVEMKDLPMTTGASDAKTDHEMFTWQALLGGGLFPTTAGLDASRWATALTMDKTQSMQWARYQTFWSAQFKRIVEITLRAYERSNAVTFASYIADVSIDSLNLVDFPQVVSSMSQWVGSALTPFVANETITKPAARSLLSELWGLAMRALGVADYELTSPESLAASAVDSQVTATEGTEMRETIAQVTREYRDKLTNLVYRAWNTIEQAGYESTALKQGVKENLRNEMKALIRTLGPEAFGEGLREGGVEPDMLDDDDRDAIKEWVDTQLSFVNSFAGDVVEAPANDGKDAILGRVEMWVQSMEVLGNMGLASANKNQMVTFKLNAHHTTNEHCISENGTTGCLQLDGSRHRMNWFIVRKFIPRDRSGMLTCAAGGNCGCGLVSDKGDLVL